MKIFRPNDSCFRCPCAKCRADPDSMGIDATLCERLNAIQGHLYAEELEVDLVVTSGRRCAEHNADPAVCGSPKSQHLVGLAIDIAVTDPEIRYRLVDAAMVFNIQMVEVASHHLHFDVRPGLKHPRMIMGPG